MIILLYKFSFSEPDFEILLNYYQDFEESSLTFQLQKKMDLEFCVNSDQILRHFDPKNTKQFLKLYQIKFGKNVNVSNLKFINFKIY